MSKLKQKDNGDWLSCVEALNAQNLSESEADALYKDTANVMLVDISVEEMLDDKDPKSKG